MWPFKKRKIKAEPASETIESRTIGGVRVHAEIKRGRFTFTAQGQTPMHEDMALACISKRIEEDGRTFEGGTIIEGRMSLSTQVGIGDYDKRVAADDIRKAMLRLEEEIPTPEALMEQVDKSSRPVFMSPPNTRNKLEVVSYQQAKSRLAKLPSLEKLKATIEKLRMTDNPRHKLSEEDAEGIMEAGKNVVRKFRDDDLIKEQRELLVIEEMLDQLNMAKPGMVPRLMKLWNEEKPPRKTHEERLLDRIRERPWPDQER